MVEGRIGAFGDEVVVTIREATRHGGVKGDITGKLQFTPTQALWLTQGKEPATLATKNH